jgi:Pyruvate/2-oxoacid:ferredoxin oxidoreductase gamma subunit
MARTLMRFTGVGGQGVLLAGEIFAAAKIKTGGFGLKTATYTSHVRGEEHLVIFLWLLHSITTHMQMMARLTSCSLLQM